jgi:hypothetical protein
MQEKEIIVSQRGLFEARPESAEGVDYFVVSLEDMMKFETIELLKLSYLLTVCRQAAVTAVRLPMTWLMRSSESPQM